MNRIELAKRLVGMAQRVEGRKSVYGVIQGLREAQEIVANATGRRLRRAAKSEPRVNIDQLPGFSPMQLRQAIDQIVDVRQRAQQIRAQYEAVLTQIADLDAKEKKGLEALKEAALQVKEKERFLVEAERGLLEFTAYLKEQKPGIDQMIADPTSKFGDKAGDFFGRIGKKLGQQVADSVREIYHQTEEDLTHMSDNVLGLKVLAKASGVKASVLRKAGIADAIVSIRDWLAGKVDSMSHRILNFVGDIEKFIKGFVVRTELVEKSSGALDKAIKEAASQIDSALA